MYNYYQQQPTMAPPFKQATIPFQLKGYPVSSYEEAKVASVDFDGSIFFFPDVANKKIYTKQINAEGIAVLNMYELKPIPESPQPGDYVTRTEFEQALNSLIQKFTQQQSVPSEPQTYKEVF